MFKCCGPETKSLCEQIDFTAQETPNGIRIELTAKDSSKTESLKAMLKAVRDFGCC